MHGCKRVQAQIQECVDGAASVAVRHVVEQHTASCETCSTFLRSTQRIKQLVGEAPPRHVSPDFEARLRIALQERTPRPNPLAAWERFRLRFDWHLQGPAQFAAAGLAGVLLFGLFGRGVVEHQVVQAERGRQIELVVNTHRQLQDTVAQADWDVMESSISLNTGDLVSD